MAAGARERSLVLERPEGAMEVYTAVPRRGAPHPVLLFFFDNPGLRPVVRKMARDLAGEGWRVLIPDLYYRQGKIRLELPMTAADWSSVRRARDEVTITRFAGDLDALFEWLDRDPAVDATRCAALGLCIGSGYALAQAALRPERTLACLLVDPCEISDRVGSRLDFGAPYRVARGFAAIPSDVPSAYRATLDAALRGATDRAELLELPGTGHGFLTPDWQFGRHDPDAAGRTWQAVQRVLGRALHGAAPDLEGVR